MSEQATEQGASSRTAALAQLRQVFAHSDPAVLYDVFAEAMSSLQGAYGRAQDRAVDAGEQQLWVDRGVALRRYEDSVDSDDRDGQLRAIALAETERRQLESG